MGKPTVRYEMDKHLTNARVQLACVAAALKGVVPADSDIKEYITDAAKKAKTSVDKLILQLELYYNEEVV